MIIGSAICFYLFINGITGAVSNTSQILPGTSPVPGGTKIVRKIVTVDKLYGSYNKAATKSGSVNKNINKAPDFLYGIIDAPSPQTTKSSRSSRSSFVGKALVLTTAPSSGLQPNNSSLLKMVPASSASPQALALASLTNTSSTIMATPGGTVTLTTPLPMSSASTPTRVTTKSPPKTTEKAAKTPSRTTPNPLKTRQERMSVLFSDLFAAYKREAAPSNPVEIDLKVLLIKVKNTIEREGIFECVIALFIAWHDPRLQWNPEDYDNITTLAFEPESLWLPDIAMTNSADHVYSISKDTRFVVRVSSDGRSVFVPSGTSRSWCDLKLVTFPFDQQTCSLDFESWTLDNSSLVFDRSSNVLIDDSTSNYYSTQWKLCYFKTSIRNVTYSDSMGGTFQRISFTLNIHRKSSFYLVNLIFPISMLSVIQLSIFFIPGIDSASSRIAFGTTNLLTLVVFQTIVTEELPKTSDAVTALSQYIIALILFSAYGIFESVIVECILRMEEQQRAPRWIRRLVEFITRRNRDFEHQQRKQRTTTGRAITESTKVLLGNPNVAMATAKNLQNNENNKKKKFSYHDLDVVMNVDLETSKRKASIVKVAANDVTSPVMSPSLSFSLPGSTRPSSSSTTSPTSPNRFYEATKSPPILKRSRSTRSVYDNFGAGTGPGAMMATILVGANDVEARDNRCFSPTSRPPSRSRYYHHQKRHFSPPGAVESDFEDDYEEMPPRRLSLTHQHNQRQRRMNLSSNVAEHGQGVGGAGIRLNGSNNNNQNRRRSAFQLNNNGRRAGAYSNYLYWCDFAMILDYVSFLMCTFLAVFIPVALFIPLVNSTDDHSCIQ